MIRLSVLGPWQPAPRSYGEHYTHLHVEDSDGARWLLSLGDVVAGPVGVWAWRSSLVEVSGA